MSGKKTIKYWGLVVIVNLGSAVVAALAFGAWQRFRMPQSAANVPYRGDAFYELVEDVGHIPRPNAQMVAHAEVGQRRIYEVIYTTGSDHFRVVPEATKNPDACVLAFGGSFTFGDGVRDDETFAAQIVKRSEGHVAAQNFGVSGWGPHQFLAGLQSGRFQLAARCKPTDAVFLLVPPVIWWTCGVLNPWDKNGPRYRLGPYGRPVRDGRLGDPAPYNWRRWIGLDPVSKSEALGLTKAVLVEATNELERLYPGVRMHLISYRVAVPSWIDTGFSNEELAVFENDLQQAGVMPLPLEGIMPRYRFAATDYILDPTDFHPNARAHRLIADFILREIDQAGKPTP